MKDATGKEIIIGNTYGFAVTENGINVIKIGNVTGQSKTGLAEINVLKHRRSCYMYEPEDKEVLTGEKTRKKPFLLFPVNL